MVSTPDLEMDLLALQFRRVRTDAVNTRSEMPVLRAAASTIAIFVLFLGGSAAAGQTGLGVVRGGVVDSSGGFLPGVTVTATSRAGAVLATGVTGATGEFALPALPAQPITLAFELEGFTSTDVAVT